LDATVEGGCTTGGSAVSGWVADCCAASESALTLSASAVQVSRNTGDPRIISTLRAEAQMSAVLHLSCSH